MPDNPIWNRDALPQGTAVALRAFRHAVYGRPGDRPLILDQMFGNDGTAIGDAIRVLALSLGCGSRRRLRVLTPCCGLVMSDELSVLGLLSAAADGAEDELDARLNWLATRSYRADVKASAQHIAALFACHGTEISLPKGDARPAPWPQALTVCGGVSMWS